VPGAEREAKRIKRTLERAHSDNQRTTMHNKGVTTTMTTEVTTNAANKVIVVGMLDTMLVRDSGARRGTEGRAKMVAVTRREGRERGRGGRWENLTLQVRSPYGGMFAMKIELEPDVPGAELLEHAEAETMLAIEGTLQLKQTFDSRFATDRTDLRGRTDRGRPTRELHVLVSCVRAPNEQERRASSAVWLEGEVAEPPQIARHPDLPSIQLAGAILRVICARPADFPGMEATIQETVEVNVAIPTSHADAEKLYRQGNIVRVIGQLDCRMEFQGGESVRVKLAEIDAEWAARKIELADKPGELRRAEGAYLRLRQRFEAAPRLYVLAGHAEILAGEPMPLEETYAARREFVRDRRQRQAERRMRTTGYRQDRAAITGLPDAAEKAFDVPMSAIGNDAVHSAAGTTTASKPRRRTIEAATSELAGARADNFIDGAATAGGE